jgi:hypothetical protein
MYESERVVNKFRNHISGAAQHVVIDPNDIIVDNTSYRLHRIDEVNGTVGMNVIGVDCYIECQFAFLTPEDDVALCVISHYFTGRIVETDEVIQTSHVAMRTYLRCDYAVAFATELSAFVEQMQNFDPMSWLNQKTFWTTQNA